MIYKIIFFFLLSLNIFALEHIQERYYIDGYKIQSSLFFKNQKSIKLYEIPQNKYSLRIKRSQLKKLLIDNGFKGFSIKSRYVYFEVNSPIDTTEIKSFLKNHYEEKYSNIDIKKIEVHPRSFMQKLPSSYTIHIRTRNHLSKSGILSIKDNHNKKYFFNYSIEAYLNILISRVKILRDEELSKQNTKIEKTKLNKFRDIPLQKIYHSEYQVKYHIKQNSVITYKDVEKLALVKRDTTVSVSLSNSGISISFAAKALQSGKLNDIITIQKSNGKRLKAKVIAAQRVEIR